MLSRTADALYWMARYTERAENIARLMEVSYRMSLQRHGADSGYWGAALGITGLEAAYSARHGAISANAVLRFMGADFGNPSSILSCLKAARENCHAVRGTVTSEVWETINTTWLEARTSAAVLMQGEVSGSDLTKYFEWVKFRSHLSRGVTVGTMLQDQAFQVSPASPPRSVSSPWRPSSTCTKVASASPRSLSARLPPAICNSCSISAILSSLPS